MSTAPSSAAPASRPPTSSASSRSIPDRARRLEILAQAERVVDGGVDVARGDRIADAIGMELAWRIAARRLRPSGDQRLGVDFAATERFLPELDLEIGDWRRSRLGSHLSDR